LPAQATTYIESDTAGVEDTGEDVAQLLALLPGLRCVGIGGQWAYDEESWAAMVPSLSACQDLRFLGPQPTLKNLQHASAWVPHGPSATVLPVYAQGMWLCALCGSVLCAGITDVLV
jgi:hypothetical protein